MSEMEKERFVIDDDSKAEWAIQKIRELTADNKAWKEHYKEQLRKIEEQNNQSIEYFTALLQEYHARMPHKITASGNKKYELRTATLELKHQDPEYIIDREELVKYLLADPTYIDYLKPVTPDVDWKNFKKQTELVTTAIKDEATGEERIIIACADKNTGEIIEAIKVEARDDKFSVKIKED